MLYRIGNQTGFFDAEIEVDGSAVILRSRQFGDRQFGDSALNSWAQ
jgi:hypothetical protein